MFPINVNLPLKTVTDRMKSCRAVLWAIEAHGGHLAELLGESFGPLLEDGQAMPFDVQLELFRKKLTQDLDLLVASDRAYRDQRTVESVVRSRRDEQAARVNSAVVGLRQAFTGIYSEDRLGELGFARRTPQQPGELLEQAIHLVARLSDPELDLTGSRYGDFQLDAARLAQELKASVETLEPTADELAREERRTEVLQLAKDDALRDYNGSFLWIARTVESLCRLAGLEEVAKRVRPSSRRPGVTARRPEEPQGPPVGDEPAANDDGTGAATDADAPASEAVIEAA